MGWSYQVEYVDAEPCLPAPVKKQIWDPETQTFLPMTLYRQQCTPSTEQMDWLIKTYGYPGTYKNGYYWDYSMAGNFTIMDEKVYMWYKMKWENR